MKQFFQWLSLLTFVTVLLLGTSSASATSNVYYAHAKIQTNKAGAGYVYGISGSLEDGELTPDSANTHKLESQIIVKECSADTANSTASGLITLTACAREGYRFVGWRDDEGNMLSDGSEKYYQPDVSTTNYAGSYSIFDGGSWPVDPHANDPDYCDALFTAVFEFDAFEYKGVWYKLEDNKAYITHHPNSVYGNGTYNNAYTGDIVIYPQVTFKGNSYPVVGFNVVTSDFLPFSYSSITSVRLPNTIKSLPNHCFAGCKSLETLIIPEQCTYLGAGIIEHCTSLKSLVLLSTDPPEVNTTDGDLAEDEVLDNLKFFACVKDFSKYISADYWSDFFGQFYAYVMGTDGNTCGTAAFGTLTRPNLYNIQGLTAYQTVGGIIRDGKLLVKRVNYAFNTKKPAGDGIIFKVEKPNTPYLLDEKMSQYVTQTDDKCLIPVYDYELTVNQSDDNSKTFYTLDEKNAVWRKITDGVTLDRGQCYLSLPGNPSDMPDMLEMVLTNGTNPFGVRGDINGDGIVDVSDVNIAIDIVLGKDSNDNYNGRADLTGDGKVDVSDVSIIIDIVLGKN